MNRIFFVVYFCLFAAALNCQVLNKDTSAAGQIKPDNINLIAGDTTANYKITHFNLIEENKLLIPDDLFLLKYPFPYTDSAYYYSNKSTVPPLSLTLPPGNTLSGDRKDFADYFNNIYWESRPTMLQTILGNMDFAGGAALAGYRLWKDYLRKEFK
ncbi:MAG: hypothetical protein WCA84_07070 [Ignavibacteriaceae bacterium]